MLYLPYLEFHACDFCNLNCVACSHFSPLFKSDVFPDTNNLLSSLGKLKKITNIGHIRVLGGEPLLNSDIYTILCMTRKLYPDSRISLVSNGLLINNKSKLLFDTLKKNHIDICISKYPMFSKLVDEKADILRQNGIIPVVSSQIDYFRIFLKKNRIKPNGYNSCGVRGCTFLYENKIWRCAQSALIKKFNERFEMKYPEEKGLELDCIYDGSIIENFLSKPGKLCEYCADDGKLTPWSICREPRAVDWEGDY